MKIPCTCGATRRSNVRSPTRQYPAASSLVSRGESKADRFSSDGKPPIRIPDVSSSTGFAGNRSELGFSPTSCYRFCPSKSCSSRKVLGKRARHLATRSDARGCHRLSLLGVFCRKLTNIDALWNFLEQNDGLCFTNAKKRPKVFRTRQKKSVQSRTRHFESTRTIVSTGQDVGL